MLNQEGPFYSSKVSFLPTKVGGPVTSVDTVIVPPSVTSNVGSGDLPTCVGIWDRPGVLGGVGGGVVRPAGVGGVGRGVVGGLVAVFGLGVGSIISGVGGDVWVGTSGGDGGDGGRMLILGELVALDPLVLGGDGALLDFVEGDLVDLAEGDVEHVVGALLDFADGDLLDLVDGDLDDLVDGDLLDLVEGDLDDLVEGDLDDLPPLLLLSPAAVRSSTIFGVVSHLQLLVEADGDLVDFTDGDLLDLTDGDLDDLVDGDLLDLTDGDLLDLTDGDLLDLTEGDLLDLPAPES